MTKKYKILLVEDEKILAEMYRDKFIRAGFDVDTAYDAEEGIQLAKQKKPDLIVLDILLPRENGISFLERLQKNSELASIPVIVFSNYDDPKTRKEAERLGVRDYLIKANYTPEKILKKVKSYLE